MEQQDPPPPIPNPTPTTVAAAAVTATSSTTASTSSSTIPPPPATPAPPETHPSQQPVSTTPDIPIQSSPNPNRNPSPNPNPTPADPPKPPQQPQQQPQQILQPRPSPPPPSFSRPWKPPPQPPQSASTLAPTLPRGGSGGGIAIGVPTHHGAAASSPQSTSPFSPSYNQQFGSNPRASEPASSSAAPQLRPSPAQGMHGVGMIASIGSATQMRSGGIPQQRPVQQPIRPLSSPINQATTSQSFQGQTLMRASSVVPPISASPNTQSLPSPNQPWLSSATQGKPPLPPPSYRPQMSAPSLQQRPHIPQQQHQHHHQLPISSQSHSSAQAQAQAQAQPQPQQQPQPASPSPQSQDHYGHQFPPRVPQSLQPQQIARVQSSGNQKPPSMPVTQAQFSNPVAPSTNSVSAVTETNESGNRILTKRSINELLHQIDPSEKLEPEVEDVLVDIAEEFVESITTFGCSLAKHRKSTVLEAKDILLHLERNWTMSLPGFSGDEIKSYRKPVSTDIHKERLAAIKKSLAAAEATAYTKTVAGQTGGNTRGNLNKAPANVLGSPNMKN